MNEPTPRPALEAVRARRSWSKVTDAAPTREDLLPLIAAAGRVADHSAMRPWRIIEVRGDDRGTLGAALAAAQGDPTPSTKPLRAPLLLAVVARLRESAKVPHWEQEAVASGVAHTLSLLLDEAGWGVIWRTGPATRAPEVADAHGLSEGEVLLGWLYVGGKPERDRPEHRTTVDAASFVSGMPQPAPAGDDAPEGDCAARAVQSEKVARAEKAAKAEKKARHSAKKAQHAAKKARHAEKNARRAEEKAHRAAEKAQAARAAVTPEA